jgi:hypothetical protein
MTPENMIKKEILIQAIACENFKCAEEINKDNIEDLYLEFTKSDLHWDYVSEFRSGFVETEMHSPYSRNYESKAVARQMSDGSWVGWTYWYGGGKHSEPEAINWMSDAYFLDCKEEEKTIIVQTFSVK